MIVADLPPVWVPPKLAIIAVRPVLAVNLRINGEDACARLPRDLLAMPRSMRALVRPSEIRPYLPREYRRLPSGLLGALLGNVGGLPGVVMAGGVKTADIFTETGTFTVPGSWNKNDNAIHALGKGGDGADAVDYTFIGGTAGGGGGGGGAWAWLENADLTLNEDYTVTVAVSSGDTWFSATDELLAKSGATASSEAAAAGGSSASCVGDLAYSGGSGENGQSASASNRRGGYGGGAAGPDGAGSTPGSNGTTGQDAWDTKAPTVLSGGGGHYGFSDPLPGDPGDDYGGGGGGGGSRYSPLSLQPGGDGAQGVVLILNNASL